LRPRMPIRRRHFNSQLEQRVDRVDLLFSIVIPPRETGSVVDKELDLEKCGS
jgi:hypothetical protein